MKIKITDVDFGGLLKISQTSKMKIFSKIIRNLKSFVNYLSKEFYVRCLTAF